jgi:predicted short-subunit dehydrogenase-like oxidoreductase (DUF2520 family)
MKIGFIGAGIVGSALALQITKKGYEVTAVSSRRHDSAEKLAAQITGCKAAARNQTVADAADLVFITTPDDAIGKTAAKIKWHSGQSVVHCSGADSLDVLEPARKSGARTGSFHPLQTFATVRRALENTPGSTFAIEAKEPLLSALKKMADDLECQSIELKAADKALYHASAVIASNYLITLVKMATDLWQAIGVPREEATRALVPLLKGTVNNIETIGLPGCLTGPIARGDAGTVEKHLKAIQTNAPELLAAYVELAIQTIPIAKEKGKLNERQAEKLISIASKESVRQSSGTAQDRPKDSFSRV